MTISDERLAQLFEMHANAGKVTGAYLESNDEFVSILRELLALRAIPRGGVNGLQASICSALLDAFPMADKVADNYAAVAAKAALSAIEQGQEPAYWTNGNGNILAADVIELQDEDTQARFNIPLYLSPSVCEGKEEKPTHRHKRRGTEYMLMGIGKMQAGDWHDMSANPHDFQSVDMREVAIYRSATDPSEIWARPREEFEDGRFEVITHG